MNNYIKGDNMPNGLLTDEETELDWTDDDGEPAEHVTLSRSEVEGLLKAQIAKTKGKQ